MPPPIRGKKPNEQGGRLTGSFELNASTRVWRIFAGLVMGLLTVWNVANSKAVAEANDRASAGERRIRRLTREVTHLTTNLAVVTMFLSSQKPQQPTAAKRQEYQNVIDTLQKPMPKTKEDEDGDDLWATEKPPPPPKRE